MKFRRGLSQLPQPIQKLIFRRLMQDPWKHRQVYGTFGFTLPSKRRDTTILPTLTSPTSATAQLSDGRHPISAFYPTRMANPFCDEFSILVAPSTTTTLMECLSWSLDGLLRRSFRVVTGWTMACIRETREFVAAEKRRNKTQGSELK